MRRALLAIGLVAACGPPPAPSPAPAPSSTAAPVASAAPSTTSIPPSELPPGPDWPRDRVAPYSPTDVPVPEPPALVAYPEVRVDPDGARLPNGVRRRFGGERYRAPASADVFFDGSDLLAAESQWRQPLRLHDLAAGKVKHELAKGEHVYLAQAGYVVLGHRDPSVIVAKTGKRIGPRKGLMAPYAWAMNGVVGFEKGQLTLWVPGSGTRPFHRPRPNERMGELVSNGRSVVAAILRQPVKGGRDTQRLFVEDVGTGKHRTIDLGRYRNDRSIAVSEDGAVIFAHEGALRRVEVTSSKPPEKLRDLPKRHGPLAVGQKLGAIVRLVPRYTDDGEEEILVFDLKRGSLLTSIRAPADVKQLLIAPGDASVVAVDAWGEVRRYDPSTGRELTRTPGHARTADAHLTPSGGRLLTGGSRLDVWDAAANRHLRGRDLDHFLVAARLVDDTTAVTLAEDGRAQWWSLDSMATTDVFDDDGKRARSRDGTSGALDVHRGRVAIARHETSGVVVFGAGRTRVFSVEGMARGLRFGPRGELAVAGRGHLTVYDAEGRIVWRERRAFESLDDAHRGKQTRVELAFSPSGKRLAVGSAWGTTVIELSSGRVLRGVAASGPLAFEDEAHLLTADGRRIRRWSVDSARSGEGTTLEAAVVALQVHRHGVLVSLETGTTSLLAHHQLPELTAPASVDAKPPSLVATLPGTRHLSLGHTFRQPAMCAVHHSGTSCWGLGDHGLTGFGDTDFRDAPALVAGVQRGAELGSAMGCGLGEGSDWRCWGRVDPATGYRSRKAIVAPSPIEGLDHPVRSGDVRQERWCVADQDGDVICVERRVRGPLGPVSALREEVVGVEGARLVSVGGRHACAITGSAPKGPVWCWGTRNRYGQLGFGRATADVPAHAVRVEGLDDATALAAGRHHTCALRAVGTVVCWGLGRAGQLGDGTRASRARPVAVKALSQVRSLFTSNDATYAVTGDGRLHGWGHLRPWGTTASVPVVLPGFSDVVAVAADDTGLCAADEAGAIRCLARDFTPSKP